MQHEVGCGQRSRRDLTSIIPKEIQVRLERAGVGVEEIDWYAGRKSDNNYSEGFSRTPPEQLHEL